MKKIFSKIVILLVAVTMLFSLATPTLANEKDGLYNYINGNDWPEAPALGAEGAILINADTGAVVYTKNAEDKFYPASITKVLTALVVLENCENLKEELTFSYNAINDLEDGGYSYVANEGDKMTVYDALHGMLLNSSNECAYALAEHIGGSLEGFCKMMNEKAESLGAVNSHFANANGLTNSDHYTCPHDMALILRAAVANERFLEIDTKVTYKTAPTSTRPDGYACEMGHKMMHKNLEYYDSRVICGKTGFLTVAKNTLVTYAEKDGVHLICVVMRCNGGSQAYADTRALLDYGFNNFEYKDITVVTDIKQLIETIDAGRPGDVADVIFDNSAMVYYPKSKTPHLTYTVVFNEEVNDSEGDIYYLLGDMPVSSDDFTLEYAYSKPILVIRHALTNDQGNIAWYTVALLIVFVILLCFIGYLVSVRIKDKKRAKKREKKRAKKLKKELFDNPLD